MNNINTRKWSTPMIIGAGLFVSLSGVLMFLHVEGPLELAHEWIGLVFAFGIVLHVLNHWISFKSYFHQRRPLTIIALVVVATTTFIITSATQEGGNLMKNIVHSVEGAPLTEVAPLLDQNVESIVNKFETAGFMVQGPEGSIAEIAATNGVEPKALIHILYN